MMVAIIPTINCLKYLKQTIASLPPDVIDLTIVIDQASTDGTGDWLRRQPEILTLTQRRNIGVAPAWNLGILSAIHVGATHIAVLNHDIILAPDTLHRLVAWSEAGLAVPTVKPIPHNSEFSTPCIPPRSIGPMFDDRPRERWVTRPGDFCGFLVTPDVIDRVGWFDERYETAYIEDLDYELRLLEAGVSHGMAHDALVYHYGSRAIWEGGVENGAAFRKNVAYFQRKWGMFHEIARRKIAGAGPPVLTPSAPSKSANSLTGYAGKA